MENIISVILTALFSGLVATAVIIWWQKQSQKKAEKIRIFTVLMAKRYNITALESVDSMNQIEVVFYASKPVIAAWREFLNASNLPDSPTRNQTITDKHLKLLESIATDIGYKNIDWENIKRYYFPVGLSRQLQDEAILRKVQIDLGLAQINEVNRQRDVTQVP